MELYQILTHKLAPLLERDLWLTFANENFYKLGAFILFLKGQLDLLLYDVDAHRLARSVHCVLEERILHVQGISQITLVNQNVYHCWILHFIQYFHYHKVSPIHYCFFLNFCKLLLTKIYLNALWYVEYFQRQFIMLFILPS